MQIVIQARVYDDNSSKEFIEQLKEILALQFISNTENITIKVELNIERYYE